MVPYYHLYLVHHGCQGQFPHPMLRAYTGRMYPFAVLAASFVLVIAWRRRDLRSDMLWSGLFVAPVTLLPILFQLRYPSLNQVLVLGLARFIVGFSLGALSSALYKVAFRRYITPIPHPKRHQLGWLVLGPVLSVALAWLMHWGLIIALLLGLCIDLAVLIIWRRDLIWDMLFSGLAMGSIYGAVFVILYLSLSGHVPSFLANTRLSGVVFSSVPIEEIATVVLIGALAGPLYLAVKGKAEQGAAWGTYHGAHARGKQAVIAAFTLMLLVAGSWSGNVFVFLPEVVEASPSRNQASVALNEEVVLRLNRPIRRELLEAAITPAIEGSWRFEDPVGTSRFFKTVVFEPTGIYKADTTYTVTLGNITNILGVANTKYEMSFHTQGVPTVATASLTDGQVGVSPCDPIQINLTHPNTGIADFSVQFDPPIENTVVLSDTKTRYAVTPSSCFAQDAVYSLRVVRTLVLRNRATGTVSSTSDPEEVYALRYRTKPAPGLSRTEPSGSMVYPDETKAITLTFGEDMKQAIPQDLLAVNPPVQGTWEWIDGRRLRYMLTGSLAFNTKYSVTVRAGLPDARGGRTDKEVTASFSTIGPVRVVALSPKDRASGVKERSPVSITFDQAVDHASAEGAFHLTPARDGTFSWEGNTMRFQTTWEKDASYSFSIDAGVRSLRGQPSTSSYSGRFSTEESTTLLSIALDIQDHTLSCEVASLKMALAYKGVRVGEGELMERVGYDPTPHENGIWGDPDVAFVGSLDGRQNTTGYGVHWGPIAKAARAYRSAEAFSGWSAAQVAAQIAQGNPVVMWGIYPGGKREGWKTPAGRYIDAWKGEHVRTVIGFTGKAEAPTSFIINDPIVGRLTWSTSQFNGNWSTYGNSGVVVY